MNKIAQTIYLERVNQGLTQKDLAIKSGIPQPNISAIERGRDFQVSTLFKLATALDKRPSELLDGTKPLSVDKRLFFKRNNIEKLVQNLSTTKLLHTKLDNCLADAFVRRNLTKKQLELSWIKLKKTFSKDELDTIMNRLGKTKKRLS